MCWFPLLISVLATFLMAWGQGWLMAALKLTPDNTPQSNRQKFALHYILGVVWFLPVAVIVYYTRTWEPVVIALAVRFILFDACLRYFEDNPAIPVFHVGESANTDKLIRFVAMFFGWQVTRFNAVLRGIAIPFLLWFMVTFCG